MDTNCNTSSDTGVYLAKFYSIFSDMVTAMTAVQNGNSISQNFIERMIPHHEAAIEMSKNILSYTKNEQLKAIAENIIAEQTKSIEIFTYQHKILRDFLLIIFMIKVSIGETNELL